MSCVAAVLDLQWSTSKQLSSASYVRLLKKFVFGRMLECLLRQTKLDILWLPSESSVTVASHTGLDPHLEATLRAWNNL